MKLNGIIKIIIYTSLQLVFCIVICVFIYNIIRDDRLVEFEYVIINLISVLALGLLYTAKVVLVKSILQTKLKLGLLFELLVSLRVCSICTYLWFGEYDVTDSINKIVLIIFVVNIVFCFIENELSAFKTVIISALTIVLYKTIETVILDSFITSISINFPMLWVEIDSFNYTRLILILSILSILLFLLIFLFVKNHQIQKDPENVYSLSDVIVVYIGTSVFAFNVFKYQITLFIIDALF
jgi:hypothetical protein